MTRTATKLEPGMPPSADPELPEPGPVQVGHEKGVAWLRLLWGERRFLARGLLVGMSVGLLLSIYLKNEYQSSTQLMPPDNQSTSAMAMLAAMSSRSGASGLGAVAGDLLGMKSSGALFIGVLRSRTVADRLIDRFDLNKIYGTHGEESARSKLSGRTSIAEDRKSGIITVSFTDGNPQRAAAIAQAYVDELNQLVAELSTSAAHRERVFLEGRLGAVKQDLDDASQKFSQFSSKNATLDIKDQGKAMVDAASRLQGELIATDSQLKGLEEIYTPDNVRVRSLRARISELQRQLDKLGGKGTTDLTGSTDSDYPSIRQLPLLGVTYADLYRRTRIEEVVYETLTQQYELAKVQEAKETPSVKVLDSAHVPERKSYPPRLLILLLCMSFGVAASVVSLLVRKRWHEVAPDDPRKILATEMFQTANSRMPWASPNGSVVQAKTHRVWLRLMRRPGSAATAEEPPIQS